MAERYPSQIKEAPIGGGERRELSEAERREHYEKIKGFIWVGRIDSAKRYAQVYLVPNDIMQQVVEEAVASATEYGTLEYAIDLDEAFGEEINRGFFLEPEFEQHEEKGLLAAIQKGELDKAIHSAKELFFEELLLKPQLQQALIEELKRYADPQAKGTSLSVLIEATDFFTEETWTTFKDDLLSILLSRARGGYDEFIDIIKRQGDLRLTHGEMTLLYREYLEANIRSRLRRGSLTAEKEILSYKTTYLSKEKIRSICLGILEKSLDEGDFDLGRISDDFLKEYSVSKKDLSRLKEKVIVWYGRHLQGDRYFRTVSPHLKKMFDITHTDLEKIEGEIDMSFVKQLAEELAFRSESPDITDVLVKNFLKSFDQDRMLKRLKPKDKQSAQEKIRQSALQLIRRYMLNYANSSFDAFSFFLAVEDAHKFGITQEDLRELGIRELVLPILVSGRALREGLTKRIIEQGHLFSLTDEDVQMVKERVLSAYVQDWEQRELAHIGRNNRGYYREDYLLSQVQHLRGCAEFLSIPDEEIASTLRQTIRAYMKKVASYNPASLIAYLSHKEQFGPLIEFTQDEYDEIVGLAMRTDPSETISLIKKLNLPLGRYQEDYLSSFSPDVRVVILPHWDDWFKRTEPTMKEFWSALDDLRFVLKDRPWLVDELIHPTVIAQGIGAFRLLAELKALGTVISEPADAAMLREIVAKGVQAIDTIVFIKEGVQENVFASPLYLNPYLPEFLSSFPSILSIYQEYTAIKDDRTLDVRQREQKVSALYTEITRMKQNIVDGMCRKTDLEDPTYVALVYHTFPPATTLDRNQYQRLIRYRHDRQKDMPKAWQPLQQREITIAQGRYELKEGESLNAEAWDVLQTPIQSENKKTGEALIFQDKDIVDLGKRLMEALADPKILKRERMRLLADVYRLHRFKDGVTLTEDLTSRENLMEVKEYVGDRMKDVVDLTLKFYSSAHPREYEDMVKRAATITIEEKAKKGIVSAMIEVLASVRRDRGGRVTAVSLSAQETDARLKDILGRYGIPVEGSILDAVLERVQHFTDRRSEDAEMKKEVEAFLRGLLEGAALERRPGKLSVEITQRLLGNEYSQMQREMEKYQFIEGVEGGEKNMFRLEISKKRAHAVAGLNSGVCVAVDDRLWAKSEFFNVIIWDQDNVARGGMHFDIVHDTDGSTYLSLPGINPSSNLLGTVNAEKLYDGMIDFAKEAGRLIGAKSILIPTNGTIHSNRDVIQRLIAKNEYPKKSLKQEHEFSYNPYSYSWLDAYEVVL